MAFDYKKEYKEFYLPPKKPVIVELPAMNYVAVRGSGDPNDPEGEYKKALNILYGIAFTIKMSCRGSHKIDGYFSYVVPPLEGLWTMGTDIAGGIDYSHKERFQWISMIRLPDFVKREDFEWAVKEATAKKKSDFSKAEFLTYEEGICVQCMHVGSYDQEPETIRRMEQFAMEQGYAIDLSKRRLHHEIYLSDPRRTAEEKLRTVIRHPIKKLCLTLYKGRPEHTDGRLDKEIRVYDLLDRLGIAYERIDHEAAMTMEVCHDIDEALGATICKNLFLCNRQKTNFYLLMICGDKTFHTKEISAQIGSARLSFADASFMEEYLDITPGSVSVMGLMNDVDNHVQLLVDEDILKGKYLGCHPCINTSSLKLQTQDVFDTFLKAVHHDMTIVRLSSDDTNPASWV